MGWSPPCEILNTPLGVPPAIGGGGVNNSLHDVAVVNARRSYIGPADSAMQGAGEQGGQNMPS